MQVKSLGLEDPLEDGKAPYSSILAIDKIPQTKENGGVHGVRKESDMTEVT